MTHVPPTAPRLSACWFGFGMNGCALVPTALMARCTRPLAFKMRKTVPITLGSHECTIDSGDLLVIDCDTAKLGVGELALYGANGALTIEAYHPRLKRQAVRGRLVGVVCGRTGDTRTLPAAKAPRAA